jgi:DNA-binding transcriptional LysR family regulator
MDTLQLRLFVSIANTLNFSRTAEQFFITQPAVTHHIKMLENSLGVKLLSRTSRKVALSEEGVEFLNYANQALEVISDGENRIQNMAQGRKGHIRIAALSSISYQLRSCLMMLYKNYPEIQVDVDILEGSELINAAQKVDYDFYFSISDMIPSLNYESIQISGDTLELFVNTGMVGRIDMSDWSTVERHPFVSIRKSDAWLTSRIKLLCKNRGIVPNIINYFNRADAVILSVDAGIGIAILPGELKHLYPHPNVVTLPIHGEDAVVSYVIAWRITNNTTACNIFKDVIMTTFGNNA